MLGSVSYQDFPRKEEFLQNLELIDSALAKLEVECRSNSTIWQNLNSTPPIFLLLSLFSCTVGLSPKFIKKKIGFWALSKIL